MVIDEMMKNNILGEIKQKVEAEENAIDSRSISISMEFPTELPEESKRAIIGNFTELIQQKFPGVSWKEDQGVMIIRPFSTNIAAEQRQRLLETKRATARAELNLQKEFNAELEHKKSIQEITAEVRAGKWGFGAERKINLEAAGYDYNEIQTYMNKLYNDMDDKSSRFKLIEQLEYIVGQLKDPENRSIDAKVDINIKITKTNSVAHNIKLLRKGFIWPNIFKRS